VAEAISSLFGQVLQNIFPTNIIVIGLFIIIIFVILIWKTNIGIVGIFPIFLILFYALSLSLGEPFNLLFFAAGAITMGVFFLAVMAISQR
jgi:hypothetical protein